MNAQVCEQGWLSELAHVQCSAGSCVSVESIIAACNDSCVGLAALHVIESRDSAGVAAGGLHGDSK